jgi:N-acetylmuramic acid 6-phosphate etherase
MSYLLELLGIKPAPLSIDYVENRTQFHLYSLLTEQRHPKTWNLSYVVQSDVASGLRMLLSVDQDITRRIQELGDNPAPLEQASAAIVDAVLAGRRIYIYGCGATGRLAKQMESAFWRPFWRRMKQHASWQRVRARVGDNIEDALIGEMTGADRALVSSLEGFEDLQLIGRLQMQDHGIRRGDVVICVTEGGETSSVIGTILAALELYRPMDAQAEEEARKNLYFVCNNPVSLLLPFARSAAVLMNRSITHIDLTTGPQGITGSTRMQATTIETFVVGAILEEALERILTGCLSGDELRGLGFGVRSGLTARLADFEAARKAVEAAAGDIASLTRLEADAYRRNRFSTYLANQALITVFIDGTERSPTFRLYPLDKVDDTQRHSWVQVWTEAPDLHAAWRAFLGRSFRGLNPDLYQPAFAAGVDDEYLREAALRSLKSAGNNQEYCYDFSFSRSNIERRNPAPGDVGILVVLEEETDALANPDSSCRKFMALCHDRGAAVAVLAVAGSERQRKLQKVLAPLLETQDVWVPVALDLPGDPITLRRQIALKMSLNSHSTAVMAALGRVIGNTMTNVSPSNLKLIGRATYLILSHVNDILGQSAWRERHGAVMPVSFAEANAVLIDAMEYVNAREMGQTAEVALSIVRIVEALDRGESVTWEEARRITEEEGLASYLGRRDSRRSAAR